MPLDYQKLGLKVGLEIHQQLEGKKLFCNCPTILRDDAPNFELKRFLKASSSELGETDIAASTEAKKEKYFIYQGYNDTNCLVELDEEPPRDLNIHSLKTCLELCLLLKSKIVDEVEVMRKIVVNGSNTSGFQRTSLVGYKGTLEDKDNNIGIQTICLEEDAAKDVEQTSEFYKFKLDRLGIPLIEIATDPDIKTGEQAKRVAEKIGMFLRSTTGIKRGLGTIRQDLNVSIFGGERIEIKGAQDLKLIPAWIESEATRQHNLIEIRNILAERKITKQDIKKEFIDITHLLKNSESKVIKNALAKENHLILALKLKGFNSLLGKEVQVGRRLGTEFSDHGKVIGGIGGLFHSDELPNYGITAEEKFKIKSLLKCEEIDAFLLVADTKNKVEKAMEAIYNRVLYSFVGVPPEVRKPNPDSSTSFLRPIPGASRMYPETDVKPIKITKELLNEVKLPELLSDKTERIEEEFNISGEIAKEIVRKNIDLENYTLTYKNLSPTFISSVLIALPKEAKARFNLEINLKEEQYHEILSLINDNKLPRDVAIDVIVDLQKTGKINFDKYKAMDEDELNKAIIEIMAKNKGAPFNALMGEAMKRLKGKAEASKISEILRKLTSQ